MFTPSAVIGMWFRGLMGVAVISGAVCLFALWYRELPRPVEEVRPLPNQQLDEPRSYTASWRSRENFFLAARTRQTNRFADSGTFIKPAFSRRGSAYLPAVASSRKGRTIV